MKGPERCISLPDCSVDCGDDIGPLPCDADNVAVDDPRFFYGQRDLGRRRPPLQVPVFCRELFETGGAFGHGAREQPQAEAPTGPGHTVHTAPPAEGCQRRSPAGFAPVVPALVDDALQSFARALGHGFSVSMVLDSIGVLEVQLRMEHQGMPGVLAVQFELTERLIPLSVVHEIGIAQHAAQGGCGGAWMVRVELHSALGFSFVFDGTAHGECQAHYFGHCLQMLAKRAVLEERKRTNSDDGKLRWHARAVGAPKGKAADLCAPLELPRPT